MPMSFHQKYASQRSAASQRGRFGGGGSVVATAVDGWSGDVLAMWSNLFP